SVEGDQLELEVLPSIANDVHAEFSAQRPIFALNAPLRLDAPLRVALKDVVDSFNRDGANAACGPTSTGFFISLAEFDRRAIEPTLAMRALADASMLISSVSKSMPVTREFGSEIRTGVIIHPRFIGRFDPANFGDIGKEVGARAAT